MFWKRPFHDRGREVDWVILSVALFLKDSKQRTNLPLLRLSAGVIIRGRMTPRFSKLNKGADNQNDHEILLSAPLTYQGQRTDYWVCCQWRSWRRITLARKWSNSAVFASYFFCVNTDSMEKMPMSNPIKWSCDYSRAWLTMVNVPARWDLRR